MPQAKPPQFAIELLRSPKLDGVGVFRFAAKRDSAVYAFHEIRCDIGGRGFALHRLGLGTLYHVRVGNRTDSSCECMGYLRHGRCRHLHALRSLIDSNEI